MVNTSVCKRSFTCDGLWASDLLSSWFQAIWELLIRRDGQHLSWWQCTWINGADFHSHPCSRCWFVCADLWAVVIFGFPLSCLTFGLVHTLLVSWQTCLNCSLVWLKNVLDESKVWSPFFLSSLREVVINWNYVLFSFLWPKMRYWRTILLLHCCSSTLPRLDSYLNSTY